MTQSIPLEKLTKAYIKLREQRSQLAADFRTQDQVLLERQDKIKEALLNHCKEHNVESVKTTEGTFYRQVKRRYWTSDWESMYKFVLEHQLPEFFDKRLNQKNVGQFLEENPEMVPPGLNVESEYVVSVRKK
jgi:Zn/Cd-binding protein ZinT